MIDEAHRSQSGDLGDNLFEAFPNATRLAFTGTPLIVVKDRKQTVERFGQYIDKYKLQDAVDDGATVQILYEGKTADSAIGHKHEFDAKVDELAQQHVESQMRKAENVARLQKDRGAGSRALRRPGPGTYRRGDTGTQEEVGYHRRHPGSRPADRRDRHGSGEPLRRQHPAERFQGPGGLLFEDGGGQVQAVHRPGSRRPACRRAGQARLDWRSQRDVGSRPRQLVGTRSSASGSPS